MNCCECARRTHTHVIYSLVSLFLSKFVHVVNFSRIHRLHLEPARHADLSDQRTSFDRKRTHSVSSQLKSLPRAASRASISLFLLLPTKTSVHVRTDTPRTRRTRAWRKRRLLTERVSYLDVIPKSICGTFPPYPRSP